MSVRHPGIESSTPGPHIATVVFLVMMLSLGAMMIGDRLAGSNTGASPEAPLQSAATDDAMTLAFQGDERERTDTREDDSAPAPGTPPEVSAEAMVVMDATTGEAIFAENADDARDVGSTMKIVTALVVRDHAELDDPVTVIESDLVDPMVFSNMGLQTGDSLTVEQLLWGLLVPSGSDGANALARYVGGLIEPGTDEPVTAFVSAMNEKAASLGMKNSVFANPHGNDAEGAHSSARDLAIGAQALLADPVLAEIVAMPGYSFISVGPEARDYSAQSTNQLLTEGDEGILGVKSGSTEAAGGCLVLAFAGSDGRPVILVTLGSDLTYEDGWITTDARWDEARTLVGWLRQDEP